ncbi:MAG: glycoside hydrolase N-terminal domain-containing protein, partial [Clostridia bacterium]
MKKLVSYVLSLSMICSSFAGLGISARAEDDIVFKHQNVVGSQTCYGDDTDEKTITEIPDVYQGMRINQSVFRVEGLTASESYTVKEELKDGTVLKTDEVTATKPEPEENPTYTFGTAFNQIKEFNTSSLSETKIGDTGLKVSTNSSNYNNVVIMDASTKSGTGYYPLGTTLPNNGFYLFLGSGGNGNVSATLKFDNPITAGKYIKITYAKPSVTNNGSSNRTANNAHVMAVGTENIDVVGMGCENDKWYTTTVKATSEISKIDFTLGKWAALAISKIEVTDSADTLEFTAENDVAEKYITPDNQTVQYSAKVYNSVTTLMGSDEIIAKGTADDTAAVEYSVNGYSGVSIDANGLLTITSAAAPGTVTVTAKNGKSEKSVSILLKALGNADSLVIYGDEVVKTGAENVTAKYKAIPASEGMVVPARDTKWEIAGETNGASIAEDGTLTVPSTAAAGIIKIKATLTTSNIQTEEISTEFPVTIRTAASKACPYEITGVLLKNGETDITKADGIEGLIINKTTDTSDSYKAVVKVFDENDRAIAEQTIDIDGLTDGVQRVDLSLLFKNAVKLKAYIAETNAEITEDIPLVDDYEIKVYGNGNSIAQIDVHKKDEGTKEANLIIAQYKGGELKKMDVKPVSLAKGKNEIPDTAVTLENNAVFKVFLWEDINSLKPLADSVSGFTQKQYALGAVASDEILETAEGEYTNVPLVADWITGTKSGLGMGAGVIAPSGAPYGVDPELVDVSTLNVSYTYDDNYPVQTTDNALWYKTGAYLASSNGANNSIYARDGADWEQKALPIGNGYMGGMLFGLPDKDQIQINEETFWAAGYRGTQTPVNSDTVNSKMSEGINGFMSVGNIFVDFDMPKGATVNNYYRDLNLDESVAHVQYEYNGVKYNREYFASYPKETLVFRYTADTDNALSFDVKPVSMHPGEVTVNNGEITIIGKLKDSEPYSSGGNAAWNQESDLEYCTKIKVIADDGTLTDGYNTVNVSGA